MLVENSTFKKLISWHLVPSFYGKKMGKQGEAFFSWAPKSLQMVHCSHKIKRCLLLGRKAMMNLDRVLKSRDITLPTKVCIVKDMFSPVVMYGCESWTIKKVEC